MFYFFFPTAINSPPLAQRILIGEKASSGLTESDFLLLSCWAHCLPGRELDSELLQHRPWKEGCFRLWSVLWQSPCCHTVNADRLGDVGGLSLTHARTGTAGHSCPFVVSPALWTDGLLTARGVQSCLHPVPWFTLSWTHSPLGRPQILTEQFAGARPHVCEDREMRDSRSGIGTVLPRAGRAWLCLEEQRRAFLGKGCLRRTWEDDGILSSGTEEWGHLAVGTLKAG